MPSSLVTFLAVLNLVFGRRDSLQKYPASFATNRSCGHFCSTDRSNQRAFLQTASGLQSEVDEEDTVGGDVRPKGNVSFTGVSRSCGAASVVTWSLPQEYLSGPKQWFGAIRGKNGRLYGIPFNAPHVLEVDPIAEAATAFGDLAVGGSKYQGAVLANNGHIIGVPYFASAVLDVDPEARQVSTFGDFGSDTFKFSAAVLGKNGRIYGIPYNAQAVLEINPEARSGQLFGFFPDPASGHHPINEKFEAGVVAANGHIFCVPGRYEAVLEIIPETQSVQTFGTLPKKHAKYMDGVLGKDGRIYGIPYNADQVLEIDPDGRSISLFGSLGTSCHKFKGGVMHSNGKIYGIPYNSRSVLEINPATRTATTFGFLEKGFSKFAGGVLTNQGRILALPYNAENILEIDPEARWVTTFGNLKGKFPQQQETLKTFPGAGSTIYKFLGPGALGYDGRIYGIPHNANAVLRIGPC